MRRSRRRRARRSNPISKKTLYWVGGIGGVAALGLVIYLATREKGAASALPTTTTARSLMPQGGGGYQGGPLPVPPTPLDQGGGGGGGAKPPNPASYPSPQAWEQDMYKYLAALQVAGATWDTINKVWGSVQTVFNSVFKFALPPLDFKILGSYVGLF